MTALPHSHQHRIATLATRCREEFAEVADVALWSMTAVEAGEVLVELTRARAQLDETLMRVLRHAETVETGHDTGATSATNWWSHVTRTTRAEAHRTARLAAALERHDTVRAALASGAVLTDQAHVIVEAVDALPSDAEAWVAVAGTEFLLDQAADHDAKALRELGRRLLEVIDPAAADAEEAKRLEAEERDARAAASFTMNDDGHRCRGRYDIPSLHGKMLRKHLLAQASPAGKPTQAQGQDGGSQEGGGQGGERPLSRHRLGLAFMDYIESRPEHTIPSAGGVAATVVVTMDLDTLTGGLKAASLDVGGKISASEARRIACKAGIIPVVLGGTSVVLDVGRKRRFHSEAQRIALGVRDGGCTAHGCDAPPGLCQAHHDTPWSKDGVTSVENGRLLCAKHHRLIHDPTFQHALDKHGKVRFSRRT